jgi:hypothetical protein
VSKKSFNPAKFLKLPLHQWLGFFLDLRPQPSHEETTTSSQAAAQGKSEQFLIELHGSRRSWAELWICVQSHHPGCSKIHHLHSKFNAPRRVGALEPYSKDIGDIGLHVFEKRSDPTST